MVSCACPEFGGVRDAEGNRWVSKMRDAILRCLLSVLSLLVCAVGMELRAEERVRFGREVLPILSARCFACHGPDEAQRQAGLRLDLEQDAKSPHAGGIPILAGDVAGSTLWQRINSSDPELVMPPPEAHGELKPEQRDVLRRWIEEGAVWGRHWSFEPLERPLVETDSAKAIDQLIQEALRQRGLSLRPQAGPHELVRRVYLDTIGLPPTPERADAFARQPDEAAWEQLIDELLAMPEFGEHWARMWMDLSRYADTKGYEKDLGRTMWPWRDWLIRAINADMPLDQMTREMLAGDLLPGATEEQKLATAFHRNTMSNDEGGTDDEEFRGIAVKDRVDTTLQVWMGLTVGCAKCHTHKYDPLTHADYYSLYAIFNQTQDADRYDDSPLLEVVSPELSEQREQSRQRIRDVQGRLVRAEQVDAAREDALWSVPEVTDSVSQQGATLTRQSDGTVLVSGTSPAEDVYTLNMRVAGRVTALRLQALVPESGGDVGVGRNPRDPNFVLSELELEVVEGERVRRLTIGSARADYAQDNWPVAAAYDGQLKTGWAVSPKQREPHAAVFVLSEPVDVSEAGVLRIVMRQHYGDSLTFRHFRWSITGRDASETQPLEPSAETRELRESLAEARRELEAVNARIPRTPVMVAVGEGQRRETRIHRRGNFLDPGDVVPAALPSAFSEGWIEKLSGREPNRLDLANWLMSPDNTLTGRVWANRIWARIHGQGIVETEEDFGALGALPANAPLLDWLACEYRDNGWSLKKFLKTLFLSDAYRQGSELTPELLSADAGNVLTSRGARYRLSGETIRDQMLAVSGLLSEKRGGPSVMPPQPDGLWRSTYNGQKWTNAEGEDRYRRAVYTYLKRTTPYPSLTTFDGGSGEVCQIRRIRTNTPLQARVTLNDPVSLEAAGALARRMTESPGQAVERGLRLALIRLARDEEVQRLQALQRSIQQSLTEGPAARQIVRTARVEVPSGMSEAEFAGWIVVAGTILNLDEMLTRH